MRLIALIASFVLVTCLFPSICITTAESASNQSAYVTPIANDTAKSELVSLLEEAQNISAMKPTNRDELRTFVKEAYTHALVTSKNKALKDFMDLNGTWVRGDVYIFAQDFNGTSLCLPYMPEGVGTNRMNIQNDQGVYINREMRAIAMNGSGYYEYRWRNPINNQSEPKVSFVTKVDDTWWLGAGIYEAGESPA